MEADANTTAISNLVAAISSTLLIGDMSGGSLKTFLTMFEQMNVGLLPAGPVSDAMAAAISMQRALLAQLGK